MRILWFNWKDRSNPIAGGAEVVNEELAKRLAADGHEVVFVVSSFANAAPTEERDGFTIHRVGSRFSVYYHAWRWYRQHGRGNFDLVIDEINTLPFFAGWYVEKNVPDYLFFHMLCREIWFYELPKWLGWVGYIAEPIYLRMLSGKSVITVSESTKQDLQKHGLGRKPITIISEGIEIEPVKDLTTISKYDTPTVLSLGAMRSMKQTLDQVQAFELAKDRIPKLAMKLAGDASGAYGKQVLDAVATSRYARDIEVLGRVSKVIKTELMQRAQLLLVTSVKEGWGLVVTEAASQGTPAVVYNADGLRDSVRDNVTGLIAKTNTPAGLADMIEELLRDPERYAQLRQAGWEWSQEITFEQSYRDFILELAQ